MTTMRSMNPSAPNFANATNAASVYGDFVNKPKYAETEKFLQNLIDRRDKIKAEERLALQDERQSRLDEQNKQLFDLKIADVDRANKDREALTQFSKGMLQPQVISGIVTDTISPEQVEKMSFTPEELAQYNAAGGDLGKLSGSVKTKAELQTKLSNFADMLPSSPEYQESAYQQAQRVASGMELTPGILEELKKYQVADITAQKEAKKDGATYLGEAKELESKIAELKTKQGAIQDKADGIGKEWGKNGSSSGSGGKKLDTDKMLKYADMVKDTDSAEELQKMIQTTFLDPELTNSQKENIAANIVISSGAKLPQGLLDFRKLNVSVEDAQKTVNAYADTLKQKGGVSSEVSNDRKPKEIDGLADELALLEARRNSALAKANSYSDGDRTSSARSLMSSRLDALLGGNNVIDTGDKSTPLTIRTNNPGAVKNASRSDKNAMWEGQIGFDEQGHAVFSSPEYGARAMAKNLQSQIKKGRTLSTLLQEYATGNQDAYIKNVSNKTGIDPNQKLTEGDIRKLMGAMVEHEAGVKNPFSADVLDKGYELALGKSPNSTSTSPESKDVDVKALFANVKSTKDKEVASTEINKLAELYKELGGDRNSAGPVDDIRINAEAINLSKKINVPAEQIVDTIKSQVRQENLINSRNEIISKRMFDTNMNKLINDPKIQTEYDKAWREEARRRGYVGTSARPFDIEEFIQKVYPEKLIYK